MTNERTVPNSPHHYHTYVLAFDEFRNMWRLSANGVIVPLNILSQDHEERYVKLGQIRGKEARELAIHVARTMLEHTYQSFDQASKLVVLDENGEVNYTFIVPTTAEQY